MAHERKEGIHIRKIQSNINRVCGFHAHKVQRSLMLTFRVKSLCLLIIIGHLGIFYHLTRACDQQAYLHMNKLHQHAFKFLSQRKHILHRGEGNHRIIATK